MSTTRLVSELAAPGDSPAIVTAAMQRLIDELAGGSGGVVVVPPGRWTTRTIVLRSGITLRLERGATLLADTDLASYPVFSYGHNKDRQPYHLIHADGCEGLTIEGDGTIDGQGQSFWNEPSGQGWAGKWYRAKSARISPLLEIRNCRGVVIRDVTIANSPGWTVHVNCCDMVTLRGVKVENYLYGPNTDGFDINGCRDVFVSDCSLRCGDDAIIIKATDDARCCERITITNCVLESNCAALGLGAETARGIRDVAISNCVVRSALRMIQIEMWEPGTIENVVITNITGRNMAGMPVERPIYMDIQQHRRPEPTLGVLRNVLISNFSAETRGRIMLTAQDGAVIENVTLRDIHLRYPEIEDASKTVPASGSNQLSNYNPHSRAVNSVLIADNVRGLHVQNITAQWPDEPAVAYHGLWCRNVTEAVVDCPRLTASRADVQTMCLTDSQVEVRALGA